MDSIIDLYLAEKRECLNSIQRNSTLYYFLREQCFVKDRVAALILWHLEDVWYLDTNPNRSLDIHFGYILSNSKADSVLCTESEIVYSKKFDILSNMGDANKRTVIDLIQNRSRLGNTMTEPEADNGDIRVSDLLIKEMIVDGSLMRSKMSRNGKGKHVTVDSSICMKDDNLNKIIDIVSDCILGLGDILKNIPDGDDAEVNKYIENFYVGRLVIIFDLYIYYCVELSQNTSFKIEELLHNSICRLCKDNQSDRLDSVFCCPQRFYKFIQLYIFKVLFNYMNSNGARPIRGFLETCYTRHIDSSAAIGETCRKVVHLMLFKVETSYFEIERLHEWTNVDGDGEEAKTATIKPPFYEFDSELSFDEIYKLSCESQFVPSTLGEPPLGPYSTLSYWNTLGIYRKALNSLNINTKVNNMIFDQKYGIVVPSNTPIVVQSGLMFGGSPSSVWYKSQVYEDSRILLFMNSELMDLYKKHGTDIGNTLLLDGPKVLLQKLLNWEQRS